MKNTVQSAENVLKFADKSNILKQWTIIRRINSGTFADVFEIQNKDNKNEICALKCSLTPKEEDKCRIATESKGYYADVRKSAREAKMLEKFRDNKYFVQIQEVEVLDREFIITENRSELTVIQYAVFIRMPIYKDEKQWRKLIGCDPRRKLCLALDISQALIALEEKGVYHRDIKPGNVLLNIDGETSNYLLSDMGEGKTDTDSVSVGGGVHGTYRYMAPEVYINPRPGKGNSGVYNLGKGNPSNEEPDTGNRRAHLSDLYSFGIILYELFNYQNIPLINKWGVLIEEAEKEFGKSDEGVYPDAIQLRSAGFKLPPPPEADPELGQIILKLCAFDMSERYQTAQEVYNALRRYVNDHHIDVDEARNIKTDSLPEPKSKNGWRKKAVVISSVTILACLGIVYTTAHLRNIRHLEESTQQQNEETEGKGNGVIDNQEPETASISRDDEENITDVEEKPKKLYAVVAADGVQMHESPELSADIRATIMKGETILVTEKLMRDNEKLWFHVQYNDQEGYIPENVLYMLNEEEGNRYLTTPIPINGI